MDSANERSSDVGLLEELLGVRLPDSYRKFLISDGSVTVYGLPVLGLPVSLDETSVWGATELVRASRPDLGLKLVAIRLMDTRALCLDLEGGAPGDAPLVEVYLRESGAPILVHGSFAGYLEEGRRSERQVEGALKHIRWLLDHGPRYDHSFEDREPQFKARDWRVMRSCLHDHVVGLAAIKHNEVMNALEVDVFLSTDHLDYEPGHGVRALSLLLLSDAYRNGVSMEIRFTRGQRGTRERVPIPVPRPLVELARSFTISFARGAEGVIAHDEAARLYAALVGFPTGALDAARRCEASGLLTLQGLCCLVSARLWTVEEASWVLLNFHEPHRLLFGADVPEDRLFYAETVTYGRAALAAAKLCHRLSGGDTEAEGSCQVDIKGPAWRITPHDACQLDWMASGDVLSLVSSNPIVVVPRPRIVFPDEDQRIWEDAKVFPPSDDDCLRFLLYAADHVRLGHLRGLAAQVAAETGVGILLLPFTCGELDEEVDQRMARGRMLRP